MWFFFFFFNLQLEGLKTKSLLENVGEGSEIIHMHELWRGFAFTKAEAGEFELRCWMYEEAYHLDDALRKESCISTGGWKSLQRLCMVNGTRNKCFGMVKEINLNCCSNLRVLKLWCLEIQTGVLDVRSLTQLKSLQIFSTSGPKSCGHMLQILGIGCLKNLVYLQLNYLETNTSLLEGIASLTSLQVFKATRCKFGVPDLIALEKIHAEYSNFPQLQTLDLCNVALRELPDLSSFSQLRKLITSECNNLTGLTSILPLIALEHLDIYECRSLKALPDLKHLVALSYFRVWNCGEVQLTLHEIEKLEAMCHGLQLLFKRGSDSAFNWSEGSSNAMLKTMLSQNVDEGPTHLNTNTCSVVLVSSTDKLTTRYTGDGLSCGAIQANCPAPWHRGLYYFELTIKDQGQKRIGIGFTDENFISSSMPGWEKNSYGYHGDDGMLYYEQGIGMPYALEFTTGDTVGAGINYAAHEIFFTQNGNVLPGVTFKDVKSMFYPTIGLGSPKEKVEVNFGQSKFVFDLESMFLKEQGCKRSYEVMGCSHDRGRSDP